MKSESDALIAFHVRHLANLSMDFCVAPLHDLVSSLQPILGYEAPTLPAPIPNSPLSRIPPFQGPKYRTVQEERPKPRDVTIWVVSELASHLQSPKDFMTPKQDTQKRVP